MAFRKILVPLDYGAQSDQVFAEALKMSQDNQGQLMLLHSVDDWSTEVHLGSFAELELDTDLSGSQAEAQRAALQQTLRDRKAWLAQYQEKAEAVGVAAEVVCQLGHAGPLIRDKAKAWPADLVVMGRRGRSGLAEVLLGSVSNYVLHHAPCSVMVIHT